MSEPLPDATASAPPEAERPRYFHLLSEIEIRNLHPVLEILRDHRDEVLARWHSLYLDHFGESRSLDEPAFRALYGRDLDAVVENLLAGDMEGFEADVRGLGLALVDRGVPFAEVVASLHLFEESTAAHFERRLKVMVRGPSVYLTFDKLSHCRMILLAGTYFAGREAEAVVRTEVLEREATLAAGGPQGRTSFHGLIGRSAPMRRIYEQIAAAAGGHGAVLIGGESGTGKELAARALHACAGASSRPFMPVNCAALPRELIESELFGHRKGAYTGAQDEYMGIIRSAGNGSVFLDEISEMPVETQAKLLRVLEEHAVRPVGVPRELPVQARFIASTNRDPEEAIRAGALRKDLWYRLGVHRIDMPPLRERRGDVPALVAHFVDLLAARGLRSVEGVDADAVAALEACPWPGNVRELRNAVEHALTAGHGPRLRRGDLPADVFRGGRAVEGAPASPNGVPTYEQAERDLICRALDATRGNKVHAALMLRISRHRLYDKLRKFGLRG